MQASVLELWAADRGRTDGSSTQRACAMAAALQVCL